MTLAQANVPTAAGNAGGPTDQRVRVAVAVHGVRTEEALALH